MTSNTLSEAGLIMLDRELSSYNGHHKIDQYHLTAGQSQPSIVTLPSKPDVDGIKQWLRPSNVNTEDIARWTGQPALKILFIQTHNDFSRSPANNPKHRTIPCRSEVKPLPDRELHRTMVKEIFGHTKLPLASLGAYIRSHITFWDDSPYRVIGQEGADGGAVTSFYTSGTSWAIAWSYFHATRHTSAVMFHREGDGDERRQELEAEILRLRHHLAHPMLLAYIKMTISLQWTFQLLDEMNWDTREIEKTLGLATWDWVLDRTIDPPYQPNIEEDAEMIAEAQEVAVDQFHVLSGKLTNVLFRLRVFRDQIGWIKRCNATYTATLSDDKQKDECTQLDQKLYQMQDLNSIYLHDAETLSHRLDKQMAIMSHQVVQRDARIGLTIAWQGRRSNSAMVALALAGFIFLPWTFIANLFATPIFDWTMHGDKVIVMGPFRVYWIVSGVLTLVLGLLWVVWMVFRQRADRKRRDRSKYLFEKALKSTVVVGPATRLNRTTTQGSLRAKVFAGLPVWWNKVKLRDEEEALSAQG
ncbi:hypothetical protein A1O3_07660 [Capronia epimyces CBS 606.96]|uniref:Uncharacterized protein n=1 Tax=Capronia epimyces CBS 606.96 TaxID=1182542 RepID=W9YGH3_9EURO|nr:uncharacterized protein A1O3_07660 [Capronia epimyces CBS 606.96]EXJ81369.1 hypothetical protein A1O3_07660 [Capronia epimyces CBS 606.96]